MNEYKFDGIDVDWEFPNLCETGKFIKLIKDIKALDCIVSVAITILPNQLIPALFNKHNGYIFKYIDVKRRLRYEFN